MSSEWASSMVYYFCMMAVSNSSLIFFLIGSIPFSQPQIPSFLILEKLFCIPLCRALSYANERAHTVQSCLHPWFIRTDSGCQIHFKGTLRFHQREFSLRQLTVNTLVKIHIGELFLDYYPEAPFYQALQHSSFHFSLPRSFAIYIIYNNRYIIIESFLLVFVLVAYIYTVTV